MKKFIIITLIFIAICLAVAGVFYWKSLPPKPVQGTIVGEVFAIKGANLVYIKPVGDNGTKQILELRISADTSFASGTLNEGDAMNSMPELVIGAVVEINYTYQASDKNNNGGRTTIDAIKRVEPSAASSEWPELVLNEDYSWNSWDTRSTTKGKVLHVVKLNAPLEGYIIYVEDVSDKEIDQYFIEKNHKFLTEELKELFEQQKIGYTVQAKGLSTPPFENSIILATASIELLLEE